MSYRSRILESLRKWLKCVRIETTRELISGTENVLIIFFFISKLRHFNEQFAFYT